MNTPKSDSTEILSKKGESRRNFLKEASLGFATATTVGAVVKIIAPKIVEAQETEIKTEQELWAYINYWEDVYLNNKNGLQAVKDDAFLIKEMGQYFEDFNFDNKFPIRNSQETPSSYATRIFNALIKETRADIKKWLEEGDSFLEITNTVENRIGKFFVAFRKSV